MKLELNDEAARAVVTQALLSQISPEERDKLIVQAIQDLFSSERGYVHRWKFVDLFGEAIKETAQEIIKEELARSERQSELRALVVSAVSQALATNSEGADKLRERVGAHILRALTGGI